MQIRSLAVILVIALLLAPVTALAEAGDVQTLYISGTYETGLAREMLNLINGFRTGDNAWCWNESNTEKVYSTDLKPLTYDYGLEKVAMQRAAELAVLYSHGRPNGTRCFTAYPSGLSGWNGENIAYGFTSTQAMFDGWAEENDPYEGQGHRRNMLSGNYRSIGIGCFRYNGQLYWAQEFSNYTSSDASEVLSTPRPVEVLSEYLLALSYGGGRISLKPGETKSLAELEMTANVANKEISCRVGGMSWTSDVPAVASVSGQSVTGGSEGEATLTGALGSLKVKVPVRVGAQSRPFAIDVGGIFTFPSGGWAGIDVDIPEVADAAKYTVTLWDLDREGYYTPESFDEAGVHRVYGMADDLFHPICFWVDVEVRDDSNEIIAHDSRMAVAYPEDNTTFLPAGLKTVCDEAFSGAMSICVMVPDGCETIGSRAFADCEALHAVRIPSSVTSIAEDAFVGCNDDFTVYAPSGSVAAEYAQHRCYRFIAIE